MNAGAQSVSGSFTAATLDAENPWPGLLPFYEDDRAFFRGREREAAELHRRVRRKRLTVLFGKSGLGKTSLLHAGLFPRLRTDDEQPLLPVYVRLDLSGRRLDLAAQIKAAVAAAAAEAEFEAPELSRDDTLWECFHRQDADFWNARNRPVLPLLVCDQFEEIITLGRGDAIHARATDVFLTELEDLVVGEPPAALKAWLDEHPQEVDGFDFESHPYKVLLSLRENYLPELEELRPRMGAIGSNRFRLRHMSGEAALEVVKQAPQLIDAEVAERVVRFVAAKPDPDTPLADLEVEPALLSVVCRELNRRSTLR